MKYFLMILAITAGICNSACAQTNADVILGKWINQDKTRVIEFTKTGNTYQAYIRQAPDKSIIGNKQVTDVLYQTGSYNGNIYLPKKSKSYPCTIAINSNGVMCITARAGFMSRSQTWTKVR